MDAKPKPWGDGSCEHCGGTDTVAARGGAHAYYNECVKILGPEVHRLTCALAESDGRHTVISSERDTAVLTLRSVLADRAKLGMDRDRLSAALEVAEGALNSINQTSVLSSSMRGWTICLDVAWKALARIRAARQGTDSERRGVVNTPDAVPERPSAEESQVANPAGAPPSSPAPPPAERTCAECGGKRRVYGRYRETGICAWFDCPGCTGRSPVAEGGERE